jgi:hypothetical protein
MTTLQLCKTALAVAALCTATASFGANMSKPDYTAAKERIEAASKADRIACDKFSGNSKDICKEKAQGKEKIARAELEFANSGVPADATKLAVARADAGYAVAKQMCDDKSGNAKDVCVSEAKATYTKALTDARLSEKIGEAKKDAAQDKDAADYRVAIEKCESLAGDAKSACLSAAKARFNKS